MNNKIINLQYTTLTIPLPDFIYDGLREFSRNANGYRPQPQILIEKISKKIKIASNYIYLTAGADEAIQMCALAYGKKTIIFTPTYTVYNDTTDFNANVQHVNAFTDNSYEISNKYIPDSTLIYIANPNNPFGFTEKGKILELVKNNKQAMVVVDEVYAEFANLSVIDEVTNFKNLIVIRSFSKSYGMAGNRIGYIVANPQTVETLRRKAQWSNISYLSTGAALQALAHDNYFTNLINEIGKRRDEFKSFLQQSGFTVLPTLINAILISFHNESEGSKFAEYLKMNNFIISHGNGNSNVGLNRSFVRISIGTKEEMETLKDTIADYKQ